MDAPARLPKVLVAVDGSPLSLVELPLARAIAGQLDASVEVIHVARPENADVGALSIRPALQQGDGLEVRLATTDPAASILEAAAESTVALLALATHGGVVGSDPHLGAVARTILAATRRTVLLIPPEHPGTIADLQFDRLLVPFDGSPATAAALAPAIQLASRLHAGIDLLYVASQEPNAQEETGRIGAPRYVDQPHHEWPGWAAEIMAHLDAALAGLPEEVRTRVYLARGDVAAEIVRFATETHAKALVLVRRSHLESGRANVLREVLNHPPCAVLLVPGPPGLGGLGTPRVRRG
ncbi:MAG: universal stress protein [Chloroflexi bacterium]|nr:universal stress protein [Chloroflexota bacterium]